MVSSASCSILETSTSHVGMSLISPMQRPAVQTYRIILAQIRIMTGISNLRRNLDRHSGTLVALFAR